MPRTTAINDRQCYLFSLFFVLLNHNATAQPVLTTVEHKKPMTNITTDHAPNSYSMSSSDSESMK